MHDYKPEDFKDHTEEHVTRVRRIATLMAAAMRSGDSGGIGLFSAKVFGHDVALLTHTMVDETGLTVEPLAIIFDESMVESLALPGDYEEVHGEHPAG